MADNNNTLIIMGGLSALGIGLGSLYLSSNNAQIRNDTNTSAQTESVINLPATNQKVDTLQSALDAEKAETERELESLETKLNEQINRRELETYNYIQTLDNKKNERIDGLEQRIYRLEQEIFDSVP